MTIVPTVCGFPSRGQAGPVAIGFDSQLLLSTGEYAVSVLLGLDAGNKPGLLAKGDLFR